MRTAYIVDRDREGASSYIRRKLGGIAGQAVANELCSRSYGRFLIHADFDPKHHKPGACQWFNCDTVVQLGIAIEGFNRKIPGLVKFQRFVLADAEDMIKQEEEDSRERAAQRRMN